MDNNRPPIDDDDDAYDWWNEWNAVPILGLGQSQDLMPQWLYDRFLIWDLEDSGNERPERRSVLTPELRDDVYELLEAKANKHVDPDQFQQLKNAFDFKHQGKPSAKDVFERYTIITADNFEQLIPKNLEYLKPEHYFFLSFLWDECRIALVDSNKIAIPLHHYYTFTRWVSSINDCSDQKTLKILLKHFHVNARLALTYSHVRQHQKNHPHVQQRPLPRSWTLRAPRRAQRPPRPHQPAMTTQGHTTATVQRQLNPTYGTLPSTGTPGMGTMKPPPPSPSPTPWQPPPAGPMPTAPRPPAYGYGSTAPAGLLEGPPMPPPHGSQLALPGQQPHGAMTPWPGPYPPYGYGWQQPAPAKVVHNHITISGSDNTLMLGDDVKKSPSKTADALQASLDQFRQQVDEDAKRLESTIKREGQQTRSTVHTLTAARPPMPVAVRHEHEQAAATSGTVLQFDEAEAVAPRTPALRSSTPCFSVGRRQQRPSVSFADPENAAPPTDSTQQTPVTVSVPAASSPTSPLEDSAVDSPSSREDTTSVPGMPRTVGTPKSSGWPSLGFMSRPFSGSKKKKAVMLEQPMENVTVEPVVETVHEESDVDSIQVRSPTAVLFSGAPNLAVVSHDSSDPSPSSQGSQGTAFFDAEPGLELDGVSLASASNAPASSDPEGKVFTATKNNKPAATTTSDGYGADVSTDDEESSDDLTDEDSTDDDDDPDPDSSPEAAMASPKPTIQETPEETQWDEDFALGQEKHVLEQGWIGEAPTAAAARLPSQSTAPEPSKTVSNQVKLDEEFAASLQAELDVQGPLSFQSDDAEDDISDDGGGKPSAKTSPTEVALKPAGVEADSKSTNDGGGKPAAKKSPTEDALEPEDDISEADSVEPFADSVEPADDDSSSVGSIVHETATKSWFGFSIFSPSKPEPMSSAELKMIAARAAEADGSSVVAADPDEDSQGNMEKSNAEELSPMHGPKVRAGPTPARIRAMTLQEMKAAEEKLEPAVAEPAEEGLHAATTDPTAMTLEEMKDAEPIIEEDEERSQVGTESTAIAKAAEEELEPAVAKVAKPNTDCSGPKKKTSPMAKGGLLGIGGNPIRGTNIPKAEASVVVETVDEESSEGSYPPVEATDGTIVPVTISIAATDPVPTETASKVEEEDGAPIAKAAEEELEPEQVDGGSVAEVETDEEGSLGTVDSTDDSDAEELEPVDGGTQHSDGRAGTWESDGLPYWGLTTGRVPRPCKSCRGQDKYCHRHRSQDPNVPPPALVVPPPVVDVVPPPVVDVVPPPVVDVVPPPVVDVVPPVEEDSIEESEEDSIEESVADAMPPPVPDEEEEGFRRVRRKRRLAKGNQP
ncbi:unknown protein [Seminavis robusta]|uniref:Uncharacterized protein n=1 Tax=Seminavis robusta TaxID=568900 RepID=A0A9N8DHD2_9STRA|nr:unknown protein [Seminavis robusta]|eukprot:Sro67_g037610.1 n/a (1339) ;mRNA; r:75967-80687